MPFGIWLHSNKAQRQQGLLRQSLGWDFSFGHIYHSGRLQWITLPNPSLTPSGLIFPKQQSCQGINPPSCRTFILFWHKLDEKKTTKNNFTAASSVPSRRCTKTPSVQTADSNLIQLCHFGDLWRGRGSGKLLLFWGRHVAIKTD